MGKISAEYLPPQNNSAVPPVVKLEFVYDEWQRLKFEDLRKWEYILSQIERARRIMAIEMQSFVNMGLGVEKAEPPEVMEIIDKLFLKFVCQQRPR